MDVFSSRIRELRKSAGLRQDDAAAALNVSQGTYSGYENGRVPPLDVAIQMAKLFDVSLDYMLGLSASRPPRSGRNDQAMLWLSRIPQQAGVQYPVTPDVISNFVDALIAYVAVDSPSGPAPINTAGSVLRALTGLLESSAGENVAELMDAANTLAVAGLSAQDSVKAFIDRKNASVTPP